MFSRSNKRCRYYEQLLGHVRAPVMGFHWDPQQEYLADARSLIFVYDFLLHTWIILIGTAVVVAPIMILSFRHAPYHVALYGKLSALLFLAIPPCLHTPPTPPHLHKTFSVAHSSSKPEFQSDKTR